MADAVAGVSIEVRIANAVQKLRRVDQAVQKFNKNTLRMNARLRLARQRFNRMGRAAKTTAGAIGTLASGVALLGFGNLLKNLARSSAGFETLHRKLKLLTQDSESYRAALGIIEKGQKKFGMGLLDTTKNVTTLVARLKPLGATMAEIETTFVGFNTAAILSGSTAQEASAAFRQLAQALGSGRLQGDEFRSIAEQVPAILGAIAETMGKPVGSLKQLASEGLLTSEVIIESLDNMAKKGGKSIEQLIKSSEAQKFKDLETQRIKERDAQILAEQEEYKEKEKELRLKEKQQKAEEKEKRVIEQRQKAEEKERKLREEELKLIEEKEQRELEAKIEEEKRIKEEQERLRQWEYKFDEEQAKREEELIRKFYKDNEDDKTDASEDVKKNNN